jgi:hypothetical protein
MSSIWLQTDLPPPRVRASRRLAQRASRDYSWSFTRRDTAEPLKAWFITELTGTRSQYPWFWVNYNDFTATSLEIMVNKGNHPQMALIQVRYYFTQMVVVFVWISDHFWVFVDISSFKKVAYSDKTVVRFLLCHL